MPLPPPPLVPDVARVTLLYRLHGELIQNSFYVRKNGGFDSAGLTAVATLFQGWFTTSLKTQLHENLTLEAVRAVDLSEAEGAGIEIQVLPAVPGSKTGENALPGNAALAIKFVTGLRGRGRQGRVYLSGIAEDDADGNAIVLATRDAILISFGNLRTSLLAAGIDPVVVSLYKGSTWVITHRGRHLQIPSPRPTAVVTPIEQYRADEYFDSQRRRLHGRGN